MKVSNQARLALHKFLSGKNLLCDVRGFDGHMGISSTFPGDGSGAPPLRPFSPVSGLIQNLGDFPPLQGAVGVNVGQACSVPTSEPSPPASSAWAGLFSSNRLKVNGLSLEYIQPSTNSTSSPSISYSYEEVSTEISLWKHALVGFVLGTKPPFKQMVGFMQRRWKVFGDVEVFVLESGVFVFNFSNNEAKQKVLDMGPWSFYDKPLFLKLWSPDCSYQRENITSIPIWIHLPQLELHLWSFALLSKIASVVRKPLFTDNMTAKRKRLAHAKLCVEVNPSSDFPTSVDIVGPDGSKYSQKIDYEWLPSTCKQCSTFSHKLSN